MGKLGRNPEIDGRNGRSDESQENEGPECFYAINSKQASQRRPCEEQGFEDEFEQESVELEANKFEDLGDAAFFDFDFEGVLLFPLNVDGVQAARNDHEDMLVAAAVINAEVNKFTAVLSADGMDLTFDRISVASKGVCVASKGVDWEGWGGKASRLLVEKKKASPEEDDHGYNDTDCSGGAGFGRCAASHGMSMGTGW